MRKLIILFFIITTHTLSYSQNLSNKPAFSYFSAGLLGGVSTLDFNSFWGSGLVEFKTNFTENIFVHLSVGYYSFDKTESAPQLFSNGSSDQNQNSGIENYNVTPASIGISYLLLPQGHSSPYIIIEAGYNAYEQTSDIPGVTNTNGSEKSFNIGFGLGIYYNSSRHWKLEMRYIYKLNNSFNNVNHILVGCSYSF